jgi:hypothetical protein
VGEERRVREREKEETETNSCCVFIGVVSLHALLKETDDGDWETLD